MTTQNRISLQDIPQYPAPWRWVGEGILMDADDDEIPLSCLFSDGPEGRKIAAAPAADLALRMIAAGIARIEAFEFCFDGIRYSHRHDWSAVMDQIGWDRARAALSKAEGR